MCRYNIELQFNEGYFVMFGSLHRQSRVYMDIQHCWIARHCAIIFQHKYWILCTPLLFSSGHGVPHYRDQHATTRHWGFFWYIIYTYFWARNHWKWKDSSGEIAFFINFANLVFVSKYILTNSSSGWKIVILGLLEAFLDKIEESWPLLKFIFTLENRSDASQKLNWDHL